MIGKIMTGKSFRGCLQYCLQDKIADERKNEQVMKDRAEIILYNQCFGNARELIQQFNEVRQLNPRVSKPVLHITLSLAKGETIPDYKLADMARECAQDLGFVNNQFVAVVHRDTVHPHIHIVANRIGFDGKTVNDSHNYQKIAKLCRRLELKHELKQVLSPNAFLPRELRNYERLDARKEQLKQDIKQCLSHSVNYREFEQQMKARQYEVIRMRGIAFRDQDKVYTKGSSVGYSLATIEQLLAQKQDLKIQPRQTPLQPGLQLEKGLNKRLKHDPEKRLKNQAVKALETLLKPNPEFTEGINPALMQEQRKRRKQKHRH